jgi:geranylgeranyl pyrophosphate synthase
MVKIYKIWFLWLFIFNYKVSYKTGVIPRLCAKMFAVIANLPKDITKKLCKFTETIGVAFQI